MTANAKRSSRVVELLAVALLATGAWLSFEHFSAGKTRFEDSQRNLNSVAALTSQIEILRQKPDRAAAQSQSAQALAEAVEKSAATAGVAQERVARIEPQQPRRAGDTDYLEHATVVALDGVTLRQLAELLKSLRASGPGLDQLRVSNLRISAPYQVRDEGSTETWNLELTLTYFVYSPKTATARNS